MAIRQNGIAEFVRDGDKMRWNYRAGIKPVEYDCNSNPDYATMSEFSQAVYWNGAKQKIVDSMAKSGETDQQKRDSAAETARLLGQLIWSGERNSLINEALQRVFGKSREEIGAFLRGLSDDEKKLVGADPRVVKMVAEIQVERATNAGIDAGDVFAKLGV